MREPLFPNSRPWRARWIWAEHAEGANARVLFRIEFEAESLAGARLFACAGTHYRVWLDGQRLGDGPVPSHPAMQYYDERPLPEGIAPGRHCLSVLVQSLGVDPGCRGGLLMELVAADGSVLVASDEQWHCLVSEAWRRDTYYETWNKVHPFQEHCDQRLLPKGWQQPGFVADSWRKPIIRESRGRTAPQVVEPWTRLVPRDIPFLDERPIHAERIHAVEECLDLVNRIRSQDVSISLAQAGRPLDWAVADCVEHLLGDAGVTVLACSTRHHDIDVDGRYDPTVILDCGRVLTGFVELVIEDAPAGARCEIGYVERLIDDRFNNAIECSLGDQVVLDAGGSTFLPLGWRCFRYVKLRVKYAERPVRISQLRIREVRYPYADRGSFRSAAGRLQAIEAICRTTLELCSIESLVDTPQREQAQWLGDVAASTVPSILACFGDVDLSGKFLRQASVSSTPAGLLANLSNVAVDLHHSLPIGDYSLWWVICLARYYRYTGDERYVHELYPEALRVMRMHLHHLDADGMIADMPGWVFIDHAHNGVEGRCAPYNAIFVGACDALVALARVKGDRWTAEHFADAAADVRRIFDATFFDAERGLIVDNVVDGSFGEIISEHGNMAAIAFACVDDARAAQLIERIFGSYDRKITKAQPFFMVVVFEALCRQGRRDIALQVLEHRWGRMLDRGQTSCSEEWYTNGSWRYGDWYGLQRTHSHAWSANAAEFLIRQLPGIEIREPGCRSVRIDPYPADFAYESRFPVPQGEIVVRWDGNAATVDLPAGVVRTDD